MLIFSQFTRMLDILEDYLALAAYPCERIDGNVALRERQAAIDRYSKGASAPQQTTCSTCSRNHRDAPFRANVRNSSRLAACHFCNYVLNGHIAWRFFAGVNTHWLQHRGA